MLNQRQVKILAEYGDDIDNVLIAIDEYRDEIEKLKEEIENLKSQ
jgi:hypothetical protein